jgi:glycosyltransferase involved in cell wall biosynthesis
MTAAVPTAPFSVLLPFYARDRADHLEAAFRSVVDQQSLRPRQVVLVQDGPVGDELASTVDRLASTRLTEVDVVRLPANAGLAAALDAGLDACRFDVVARMDADDLSREDRFELQVPMVAGGLELVGAGLHEFRVDASGELIVLGKRTPPVGHDEIVRYLPFHDPFNHPTVVFSRGAVRRAGGYRPMGTMEDYWLFARMIRAGARTDNLPDALVRYRVDEGAYRRRGGLAALRSELRLQRAFRAAGVTTRVQLIRNLAVRGGYRLVPERVRRVLYRRVIARGFHDV